MKEKLTRAHLNTYVYVNGGEIKNHIYFDVRLMPKFQFYKETISDEKKTKKNYTTIFKMSAFKQYVLLFYVHQNTLIN